MENERKQQPFLVAFLAAFGLISLPQVMKLQQRDTPPNLQGSQSSRPVTGAAAGQDRNSAERHSEDLLPLLDYLSDGSPRELERTLHERLRDYTKQRSEDKKSKAEPPNIHTLVVSLPDPVASAASPRFDEYLDVLQRAIELQGYVLDRVLLPWKAADPEDTTRKTARVRRGSDPLLDVDWTAMKTDRSKNDRPGLLVFRDAFPPNNDLSKRPSLVLAFLVPESPVSGLNKAAFHQALSLIEMYFHAQLTDEEFEAQRTGRKVLHLLTPCFNGSQASLEMVLQGWSGEPSRKDNRYHFRVIAGNASQIEERRLNRDFINNKGAASHKVTFRSMVHKSSTIRKVMLKYLQKDLNYDAKSVAILIESNTGLSQAIFQREQNRRTNRHRIETDPPTEGATNPEDFPAEFIFPLQVTEMRKAYVRAGVLQGSKLATSGAPERLNIPVDEAGSSLDLPHAFTPASSAALDEIALTQVLTTISHRKFRAVGIVATNPLDTVFLAREVRIFCPNVRLFGIQSDLLLARPEEVPFLRGMLVASTYPLYPANQWITTSFRDASRVFFSDQGSQGLYNATVAHIWEMGAMELHDGPPLLEYAAPYDPALAVDRRPPIWIGAVGERGIYPITFVPHEKIPYAVETQTGPNHPSLGVTSSADPDSAVDESRDYLYDPYNTPRARLKRVDVRTETQETKSAEHELSQNTKNHGRAQTPAALDNNDAKQSELNKLVLAMQPNPHPLYWLILLSVCFACFGLAGFTRLYARWRRSKMIDLDSNIGGIGFTQVLRFFNVEVAADVEEGVQLRLLSVERGSAAIPDAGRNVVILSRQVQRISVRVFDGESKMVVDGDVQLMPTGERNEKERIDQKTRIEQLKALPETSWHTGKLSKKDKIRVLSAVEALSGYSFPAYKPNARFADIVKNAIPPFVGGDMYVLLANLLIVGAAYVLFPLTIIATSPYALRGRYSVFFWFGVMSISASVAGASLSICALEIASRKFKKRAEAKYEAKPGDFRAGLFKLCSNDWFDPAFKVFCIVSILTWASGIGILLLRDDNHPMARLEFDRVTNLPSGLSPIFPVLFLAAAMMAWMYAQLVRRRLYRRSYMETIPADHLPRELPFQKILYDMRKNRESVNNIITRPFKSAKHVHRILLWMIPIVLCMCFVRLLTRGRPRSYEGWYFDVAIWVVFAFMLLVIIGQSIQLLALWRNAKTMLRLAIQLPMPQAFDRIPGRLKNWFFGDEDFSIREQLLLQQSEALTKRSTEDLAKIFSKIFGEPDKTTWIAEREKLLAELKKPQAALDSTRQVYAFLAPVWSALPIEDMTRFHRQENMEDPARVDWLRTWPLVSKDLGQTPELGSKLVTPRELEIVRDWVRTAEDLLALQIVRWFAPALSQLLPIMTFLVLGSISLLLAVSSYPFDQQGWLMTMTMSLIVFVATVVGRVLVGVNVDELLSRVSDTAPGRLSLDSGFISMIMSTLVPLGAALLAVSFDMSDIIRTWFGPFFQLF
jgi:hypothetical protein